MQTGDQMLVIIKEQADEPALLRYPGFQQVTR